MSKFSITVIISLCVAYLPFAKVLSAPSNVAVTATDDNSFFVTWDKIEGEEITYNLKICRITGGEAGGIIDFKETFDTVQNEGGNPKDITKILEQYGLNDWQGTNIYIAAHTAGLIQIGKSKDIGELFTPELSDITNSNYTLEIRTRSMESETKNTIDISLISESGTNLISELDISKQLSAYTIPIPDITNGNKLKFNSAMKSKPRFEIDSISIISDYEAGVPVTNTVDLISGIVECEYETEESYEEGVYVLTVYAVDANGAILSESIPQRIILTDTDMDNDDNEVEVKAPELTIEGITSGAFSLSWDDFMNTTNTTYTVNIWTNRTDGFIPGESLWKEEFLNAPATNSSIQITDKNAALYISNNSGAWDYFKTYLSPETGTIRLGNTSSNGWIKTPPLGIDGTDLTLKVRSWQYDAGKDGTKMPIEIISGNATNLLDILTINDRPSDYYIDIPKLNNDDIFIIHSTTNKKSSRVILDTIEVLRGFEPGRRVRIDISNNIVGTNLFTIVKNLPATEFFVQVEGVAKTNSITTVNHSQTIIIDLANPPTNAFWRISNFKQNYHYEDFGYVTNVTKKVPWTNGETIQGFYARKSGELIHDIRKDSRKSTTCGLYASYTNKHENCWSLSLLSSGSDSTSLDLQILNDTSKTTKEIKFHFDTYQWTFTDKSDSALLCSYVITKDILTPPKPDEWITIDSDSIQKTVVFDKANADDINLHGYAKTVNSLSLLLNLEPDEILHFRWTSPKISNAPMLGIGNLKVSIGWEEAASYIFIR